MTKVRSETPTGGRKPSEDTRAKLRAAQQALWAKKTPEEQAAQLARLSRKPKPPDPPTGGPPSGGPTNPLDDAPGGHPSARSGRQGRVGPPPPLFAVPDLPPIEHERSEEGGLPPAGPGVTGDGIPFGVTPEELADLIALPFSLMSVRRGHHWKLVEEEKQMLAEPLARQINENALVGRALGLMIDPLVIVLGFGFVIWVRLEEDRHRARNARPVGPDGPGSPSRGAPPPADGDRGPRPGHGPGTGGSLNGIPTGTDDLADPETGPTEDSPRVLAQTF